MITKRVQYRYDSVRNKIGMTDADGGLHTYTYDVMRRLTGVINPLGERTTYAYDLNGRRTSVQLANGTRTSYVYDLGSRVQMAHTLKSDDSTVSKFEYEYDGNGRRTSVLEADGSRVTWTYDRISQVTAEWRTGTNPYRHTFTYDSVGNRTLKVEDGARTTLVYDACNQLATSEDAGGITSYIYDGNGNQTVVQKPSGDRTTQVWDYENRLVKTVQPSGGVTSMAYDADGLRLKLEEPTGTKLFVWDDQNYLAETDAAGTTQAAFTTEPSTYGSLISHRKAGSSTTYHFDALGSTRALTDESEAVLERYNYTAFGTLLDSPTLFTPFLWGGMVGYYWDAALATQYIRARHYQPTIARWVSLDPIGFAGGDANLFRYAGNSPTSGGTGGWVILSTAAYGQWELAVAMSVLNYVILASMHEALRGRLLRLDPSGLDVFGTGVDPYNPDTWPKGTVGPYPPPGWPTTIPLPNSPAPKPPAPKPWPAVPLDPAAPAGCPSPLMPPPASYQPPTPIGCKVYQDYCDLGILWGCNAYWFCMTAGTAPTTNCARACIQSNLPAANTLNGPSPDPCSNLGKLGLTCPCLFYREQACIAACGATLPWMPSPTLLPFMGACNTTMNPDIIPFKPGMGPPGPVKRPDPPCDTPWCKVPWK